MSAGANVHEKFHGCSEDCKFPGVCGRQPQSMYISQDDVHQLHWLYSPSWLLPLVQSPFGITYAILLQQNAS